MNRTTKLVLRREALTRLANDELDGVVGATVAALSRICSYDNPCLTYTCATRDCTRQCTVECALLGEGGRCA